MRKESLKPGGMYLTDIYIDQEYELRYWSKKFGVSTDVLIDAVKAVGTNADDVEKHLKGPEFQPPPD